MSMPDNDSTRKTIAIKVDAEIHAELSLIAQLRGKTLADEHLQAILDHIERARTETDLADRADEAIAEIEREAAVRRAAIERLRGGRSSGASATGATSQDSGEASPSSTRRSRKSAAPSED
ncbi:hypothetical protein [Nocardia bovistercoris]|uniref:Uncharacterized protein n=1 Tax=Nocardia bovistercoris TaxID=2785916 RepID=A0A931IF37_9NOCA|nr:hypothetical protein [Nocardia bovistercoris]MBH0779383.1 hypothetical protein [Nocardia bovistercoris]